MCTGYRIGSRLHWLDPPLPYIDHKVNIEGPRDNQRRLKLEIGKRMVVSTTTALWRTSPFKHFLATASLFAFKPQAINSWYGTGYETLTERS